MSTATFRPLKKVETFARKVELAIPPDQPEIIGYITVDYRLRSKAQIKELSERNLTDEEYLPEIVAGIRGLGHPESGEELQGQAALDEALNGHYSMYLVGAIVGAYFEQFGEARRGNSKRQR